MYYRQFFGKIVFGKGKNNEKGNCNYNSITSKRLLCY